LLYYPQGRYADAEPLFRRVPRDEGKDTGAGAPGRRDHPRNLAGLLEKTNRPAAAQEADDRAKAIRAEYGRTNPLIGRA
jgi:hypothetical protein